MKAVNNYLKNVMKSVSYAASDVLTDYTPSTQEFTSTNKEFAKATYAVLKNPAMALRKSVDAIQESKVYKALDYGAKNLVEDLRTGNYYNKERKERDELALSGLDANWDDLSEFGIDEDWEKGTSSSGSSDNGITAGDMKIVESIEGSNAAVAGATVNAVISTSENQIKAGRANTGMMYMQNERLFGGLHKDISVLGSTMNEMYKIQSASFQNIDKNMSEFFTSESKLSTERNAILKEMLEMQRNMYKSASDKEKAKAKKSNRIRWNDINVNGMIDISSYFGAVKKNINSQIATLGLGGFGEDSNMLAEFMISPLEGVMKYVVDGVIPATVKAASKELDGAISGVFGNIIAELGNARSNNSSGIMGLLAKFLGVNTGVNRSIDTSKYEKGPIPFDGITRKAIIDVIPTHLRRIEAALTGRPEEIFDYNAGRWTPMSGIKKQFENIKKSAINSTTSDLMENMNPGLKKVRKGIKNKDDRDSFDKAVEQFREYLHTYTGRFNPELSAAKNKIPREYRDLYRYYDSIVEIYKNFDLVVEKDKETGKILRSRHTKNSVRIQLASKALSAKDAEEAQYRNIETSPGNVFASYFSAPKADVHGRYDSKGKFTPFNNLTRTKDNLGNSIFDYLQNINKELTFARLNGITIAGGFYDNKGKRGRKSGYSNSNSSNKFTRFSDIDIRNVSKKNDTTIQNKITENERIRKEALNAIASGDAIDIRDLSVDQQSYMLQLRNMVSENAINEYKNEIKGYNESNEISKWIDKHLLKTNIRTLKDADRAIKKAEEEDVNVNEVSDTKEKKFLDKIADAMGAGESIVGSIVGSVSDSFTNLLYTADKAIYEMMYKTELSSDDDESSKKKYNGFMDMMVNKISDTFTDVKDKIIDTLVDPIRERLGIGDDFKDRFKKGLMNTGTKVWTAFKDSNMSVYGPAYHEMMRMIGLEEGETRAQKARAKTRDKINDRINKANSVTNLADEEFNSILKEYGLNLAEYRDVTSAKEALLPLLYEDMYRSSNNLKEIARNPEYLDIALKHISSNPELLAKAGKTFGFKVNGSNTEEMTKDVKNKIGARYDTSADARYFRQAMTSSRVTGSTDTAKSYSEDIGFTGTIDEKKKMLLQLASTYGVTIENLDKLDTDEKLNKRYIRLIEKHNAKGTIGTPFTGLTTLTKGEGLINQSGFSTVPKTGVYDVTSPTHIINTEDMHSLTGSPRVSVQSALGKEKLAAKAAGYGIARNAKGTMKITNNGVSVDTDEVLSEAKKYIPEAAGGGLIGGILSLVLGLAGGPILGAAVGAGTSIISSSDKLKTALFGKEGADGKRDNSGLISKTVVDTVTKYFPDMAKYGLAGILPGLITPLGPVGGLLVGSAFGFLKNNEKFTTKYFGEEGKLHIKSSEKKILEKLIPGAFKGAGAGAAVTLLFGGPFGILGNAAVGAGLGMMTSTDEFKELLLGTEINGERVGGILGVFKDSLKPLSDSLKESVKKLIDAFDKNIIDPLANFINPAIHALPIALGKIPQKINDAIVRRTSSVIRRTADSVAKSVVGKVARAGGRLLSPVTSLASTAMSVPGKALNTAGNMLRAFDIRNGDTVDMTQKEAVQWMKDHGREKQVSSMLKVSSKVGSGEKDSLTREEAINLRNSLYRMNDTQLAADKNFRIKNRELNNLLTGYTTESGGKLTDKQVKDILKAANTGNLAKVSDILQSKGMSKGEFNKFMDEGKLKETIMATKDAQARLYSINNIGEDEAADTAKALLAKAGIGKDFNLSSAKDRKKFAALLSDQLTHLEANPDEITNKIETDNHDNVETITEQVGSITKSIDDIYKLMVAKATGNDEAIKEALGNAESRLDLGIKHANKKYDSNIESAMKVMGEDEAAKLTDAGKNALSNGKNYFAAKNYGADVINATADGNINNLDKTLKNKYDGNGNFIPDKMLEHFSDKAITAISKLGKTELGIVSKAIKNKFIAKVITTGNYTVTPDTINNLKGTVNNKALIENCKLLLQIYNKPEGKDIFSRFESIEDIMNIDLAKRADLASEFDVKYTDTNGFLSTSIRRRGGRALTYAGRFAKMTVKGAAMVTGGVASTPFKAAKAGYQKTYEATHDIHSDKWHQKQEAKAERRQSREQAVEPNTEETPVEQNGLGTILGGLFGAGKSIIGGASSLLGSVLGKKKKSNNDNTSQAAALPAIAGLLGNHNQNTAANTGSGNFDETDKRGDGRDLVHVGDGDVIQVSRDSSGNVEPDTSDSHTKSVLNKINLKNKAAEKLQAAQLKASEIISNTFDTSKLKESKGGKIGWLSLLFMGGLLWNSGILQKVYEGVVKPIWTDNIKPFITDKAVPWIKGIWTDDVKPFLTDTVGPWITNTAIPALGNMFAKTIGTLITQLPQLIWNGIKGTFDMASTVLDTATGNKYNAGGSTTVNASSLEESNGSDYVTGMYDENGNNLTVSDIQSGNFNKIYNAQGIEGTVDSSGNVTFKDNSLKGASYASTVGNAAVHGFAKSMGTNRTSLLTKATDAIGSKLFGSKSIIKKSVGAGTEALTKPVVGAENIGIATRNGLVSKTVDNAVDRILNNAISDGISDEAADKLLENIISGDGSKTSNVIKSVANFTDKGIVGTARDYTSNLISKAKNKTSGLTSKLKNIFNVGSKEAAESTTENVVQETVKAATENTMKDSIQKGVEEGVKQTTEEVTDATVKAATETTTKAKSSSMLTKVLEKAKNAIDGLFENSTVVKKLTAVAESLGETAPAKWIKTFKSKIQGIFDSALESGIKKVGSETVKKVLSKVLSVVFLVTDFVSGCDQAESILGVSETSITEELVAGLINALCNFLIIPSIVPGVNWIARKIYALFDDSLEERQQEATDEYNKYVEETGSTLTKEEYLKRQHSVTGAIGGWVGDKVSGIASGIKGAASSAWSGLKSFFGGSSDSESDSSSSDTTVANNASGTLDLSSLSTTSLSDIMLNPVKFITNSFNKISEFIGEASDGADEAGNLSDIMDKTKNGKISIFSKDYWKLDNQDSNDNTLSGSIKNAYNKLTKLMSFPVFMVKNSLEALTSDITEIGNVMSDDSTSSVSVSSGSSSSSSTSSAVKGTSFLGKVKNTFTSAISKVKSFFGFGTGTGKYKYGTGQYSKQIDPAISNIRFNSSSDSEYQTIGNSGCGPAAAVNVIESMYGKGNNVVDAAKFALNRGYKETDGGTKPGFFTDYFNSNGFGSETSYNRNTIEDNINNGMPTVIMGRDAKGTSNSTPFGKSPHYVTVTGTDGKGNAIVQDPESKYDNQLYPVKSLMKNTSLGISAFGKKYTKKRFGLGRFNKFGRGKYGRGKDSIVFIGDSRGVMMQKAIGNTESSKHTWSCKIGAGYSWMKSSGVPNIESKIDGTKAVVIMMGVNDILTSKLYSKYAEYINNKATEWTAKGAEVYYVSVNPVSDNGVKTNYGTITNDAINTWNKNIQASLSSNVKYIDTNSQMNFEFKTVDGLHYSSDVSKKLYQLIVSNVSNGTSTTTSASTSTTSSSVATTTTGVTSNTANTTSSSTTTDVSTVGGLFSSILINSKAGQAIYSLIGTSNNSSDSSDESTTQDSTTSTTTTSTGNGTFPTYNLSDAQIKGVANIIQHEQPGLSGMLAEASLMANLTDIKGDDKATVDNLVAEATGGWFAKGKTRFYNPGSPSSDAIKAAKAVMLNGKRTVPRYVNEHDCFSDLSSVTTDGKANSSKSDRSGYVPHKTKIKNTYGSSYTFYGFPNDKSDPFGYTDDSARTKWGDDCYSTDDAVAGLGKYGLGKWGRGSYDDNVWWYLRNAGMTEAGAAGLMGNLQAESDITPNKCEGILKKKINMTDTQYTDAVDSGTISKDKFLHPMGGSTQYGYGLAQWTSAGRKEGLYKAAKEKGVSISDLGTQLDWLNKELTNDYKAVTNVLKSTNSVQSASDAVMTKFERPADQSQKAKNNRASMGKSYYSKFAGKEGTPITGTEATNISSDSTDSTDSTSSDASSTTSSIVSMFSDILSNSKAGQALAQLTGVTSSSSSSTTATSDTTDSTTTSSSSTSSGSGDAANVVSVAKGEVGTKETPSNYVKYNDWYYGKSHSGGADKPWCAAFVSWVGNQAGIPTSIIPKDASTKSAYSKLINNGGKISPSESQGGDIIFFTKNGAASGIYHTGIVTGNDNSKISTVEGNSSDMVAERSYSVSDSKLLLARPQYTNAGTVTNISNDTETSSAPDYSNTRGSNGVKPLSRFGQFKKSIYGKGTEASKINQSSLDGYAKVEESNTDKQLGIAMKSASRKNVYSNKMASGKGTGTKTRSIFGFGTTTNTDYSSLINTIINILMTIADNTDKLNLIVNILNNKLNLNISASDVSNATGSTESLRSKLSTTLSGINNSNTSKLNTYADNIGDGSINSIISAMNAIASE